MYNSPGLISKNLTIRQIVNKNHLFCQDTDDNTYYVNVSNSPNNNWIGNNYPFLLTTRDYATSYKKNLTGDYKFIYSISPFPKNTFSFLFFLNIKNGNIIEMSQTNDNFNNYQMGDTFDMDHIPSYNALQVYPDTIENKNNSLILVTVVCGHGLYYICDTVDYGHITVQINDGINNLITVT